MKSKEFFVVTFLLFNSGLWAYNSGAFSHSVLAGYHSAFLNNPAFIKTMSNEFDGNMAGGTLGGSTQLGYESFSGVAGINVPLYGAIDTGDGAVGVKASYQWLQYDVYAGSFDYDPLVYYSFGLGYAHTIGIATVGLDGEFIFCDSCTALDPRLGLRLEPSRTISISAAGSFGYFLLDDLRTEVAPSLSFGIGYTVNSSFTIGAEMLLGSRFLPVYDLLIEHDVSYSLVWMAELTGEVSLNGKLGTVVERVGSSQTLDVGLGVDVRSGKGVFGFALNSLLTFSEVIPTRQNLYAQLSLAMKL